MMSGVNPVSGAPSRQSTPPPQSGGAGSQAGPTPQRIGRARATVRVAPVSPWLVVKAVGTPVQGPRKRPQSGESPEIPGGKLPRVLYFFDDVAAPAVPAAVPAAPIAAATELTLRAAEAVFAVAKGVSGEEAAVLEAVSSSVVQRIRAAAEGAAVCNPDPTVLAYFDHLSTRGSVFDAARQVYLYADAFVAHAQQGTGLTALTEAAREALSNNFEGPMDEALCDAFCANLDTDTVVNEAFFDAAHCLSKLAQSVAVAAQYLADSGAAFDERRNEKYIVQLFSVGEQTLGIRIGQGSKSNQYLRGQVVDGKFHGLGVGADENRACSGQMTNSQFNGSVQICTVGKEFLGAHINGRPEGWGNVFYEHSETEYDGYFLHNRFCGVVTYKGVQYIGKCLNEIFHGDIYRINEDGTRDKGRFEDGTFVPSV